MNKENNSARSSIKHVFVVGCPRSGTTWAGLLLQSHPMIAGCTHSEFFTSCLNHLAGWWEADRRFGKSVPIIGTGADGRTPEMKFTSILSEDEFYTLCDTFASTVFNKIASYKPGASIVAEQTPNNLRHSELILRVFPEAYFLHVIRDPRSVYCSQRGAANSGLEFGKRFPETPEDGGAYWRDDVSKGRLIAEQTPRYREVRYESLISSGPSELLGIYQWLGVPADLFTCEHIVEACSIDKLRKHEAAPSGFFRKGLAEGWREELPEEGIAAIEGVAGELMDEMGYKRFEGNG